MLGEDRHEPDDHRQLAVAGFLVEDDRQRIRGLDPHHFGIGVLEIRPAVVAQGLQREDDVGRGHLLSIGELRLRPEAERYGGKIRADVDGLGQQAVKRERLFPVASEQALESVGANTGHRLAEDDEGIGRIECSRHCLVEAAAARGTGICIGEVGEVGRQSGFAMHRQAVFRRCDGIGRQGHRPGEAQPQDGMAKSPRERAGSG